MAAGKGRCLRGVRRHRDLGGHRTHRERRGHRGRRGQRLGGPTVSVAPSQRVAARRRHVASLCALSALRGRRCGKGLAGLRAVGQRANVPYGVAKEGAARVLFAVGNKRCEFLEQTALQPFAYSNSHLLGGLLLGVELVRIMLFDKECNIADELVVRHAHLIVILHHLHLLRISVRDLDLL